jgi:hypothetical protein
VRREASAQLLSSGRLLNLIEAIAIGPSPGSPVEVSESAIFGYGHDSLYQALRRAAEALGEDITSEDWLLKLRKGRLAWLASHPPPPLREDLGSWKVRILDASNHYRPQVKTVRVGYVHGTQGMKPGHGLSVLAQRVGEGSWTLPLEMGWMPPETGPTSYGAEHRRCPCRCKGESKPFVRRRAADWGSILRSRVFRCITVFDLTEFSRKSR